MMSCLHTLSSPSYSFTFLSLLTNDSSSRNFAGLYSNRFIIILLMSVGFRTSECYASTAVELKPIKCHMRQCYIRLRSLIWTRRPLRPLGTCLKNPGQYRIASF